MQTKLRKTQQRQHGKQDISTREVHEGSERENGGWFVTWQPDLSGQWQYVYCKTNPSSSYGQSSFRSSCTCHGIGRAK